MSDFYDITHDGVRMVLPRVTKTLGIIDKSGPLMGWAVNLEREAMRTALEETLTEPGADHTPHGVWTRMQPKLNGARAWARKNREATDIGSAAHTIIHWHTQRLLGNDPGPEPSGPDEAMRAVVAWMDWCRDVEFVPLMAERTVYCQWCAVAGTLDTYGKVQGQLTVVDYKTGKAVYRESHLQLAWYRHMLKREGVDSDSGLILRLPKTAADPEFEPVPARPVPLSALRAVAMTWRVVRWLDGEETGSQKMQKCEV